MEHLPNKESSPVISDPRVRKFIEERQIKAEDYHLIEELDAFDKNLFIECLHNMFNMHKERSERELEMSIELAHTDDQRLLYQKALEFLRHYNWAIAWHLTRVLEDR